MPSPEKISGYQLAEHLLAEGGVEALIRHAGYAETDWLELKAGMCLLPKDKKKDVLKDKDVLEDKDVSKDNKKRETEKDLYWNIAKEVIALMNTSGGALVIGVHDKTLNHVPLEDNDPRHVIAAKGIDGYIREVVRSNVWPSNLMWSDCGKPWELTDKQFPADLISYHHPSYTGPDGHSGEVVVMLIKPIEEIRLARKEQKYFVLFKRTRGEVGEAQPVYDPEVIDEYKASREIESERYAKVRDRFDREHAAASESAKLAVAIKNYYNGLVEKHRRMRVVFTSLDAEENIFSKDDVDQFYSPEAIETFDDEDRWLDDDDEDEEDEHNNQEEDDDLDFEKDNDEDSLDNDDDAEDRYDERTARKGDLLELLKSEHRVIVSGEPGGGKTTCLTYFTLKFAEGEGEDPVLAVFIPMGQWRRGGSLIQMVEKQTKLDIGQIARLMKEGRLRLVIDAVNECPDEFRMAAILDIGMFLAAHPNIPAVISTRHPKELSSLQLPVFHVQPMDETHRLRYLERYLADGEQAQKLLRQLGSMPGGEIIAENPMLLRLVVEVYKESPEKRLPNGRAGLYRLSLRAWYKRENEKAKEAGRKLQWNRRQTFELLAVLAFKSRQRGYRDVPLEETTAIWGDAAENRLEMLCQGPIIYCDDEFVRFRHETFQEYLCAEYLVAHQDELPVWTQDDYAQWGMPFAYAVELFELDKQQLPESFWLAAWNLNPWLGVALTDESTGYQLSNPWFKGTRPTVAGKPLDIRLRTPYLRAICDTFDEWMLRHALREDDVPWYSREDVALRYVILVSRDCQTRWNNFEKSHLHCCNGLWDKHAIKLAKSWLTLGNPRDLFQCHAPEEWNSWIKNTSLNRAESLINAGIALPEDFREHKCHWNGEMRLSVALRLLSIHVLDCIDIEEMLPSLLEKAEVKSIAELLAMGYGGNALVTEKVQHLISDATPNTAIELIENGLATEEDFKSRLPEWLKDRSIPSAIALVRAGLAMKTDFEDVLQKWISFATPQMAAELVRIGLMMPADFSGRLVRWLQHPQYSFVRKYLKTSGELENIRRDEEVVQKWIVAGSMHSAASLIEDGLSVKEDFADKIHEWLMFSNGLEREEMLRLHLICKHELIDFENELVVMRQACDDVEKGIKVASGFVSKKNTWINSANLSTLVRLVKEGIVAKEDIIDLIKQRIDHSTPEAALYLINQKLAAINDFAGRVPDWKQILEPEVTLKLVEKKIICSEDIADIRDRLKAIVEPKTLLCVVKLGCMTLDEASEYLDTWGESVPDNVCTQLKRLIKIPKLHIGQVVRGKVKNITGFGAFIDFDGIDGLLHITNMSWGRIKHPSELLKVGQEINVKVLDVDREKEHISLGLKQITENPWDTIVEQFPEGSRVSGKVVNLTDYGAFVEIAPGIEGLVHISQFSWTKRVAHPSDMLQVGDEVQVQVLGVDPRGQKISLGIRQTQDNPWDSVLDRYPIGSRVKCKVRYFTAYGAFVELEEGIDGLIHVSDMSWTRKIRHPSECLKKDQEVEAVVLYVDPKEQRISLSLKKAQTDPWSEIATKYPVGKLVKGKVSKIASFGAFIELEDGVDGFVHISQISDERVTHVKEVLKEGQEVEARVIKVDREAYRIALSIKALAMAEEEVRALSQ